MSPRVWGFSRRLRIYGGDPQIQQGWKQGEEQVLTSGTVVACAERLVTPGSKSVKSKLTLRTTLVDPRKERMHFAVLRHALRAPAIFLRNWWASAYEEVAYV